MFNFELGTDYGLNTARLGMYFVIYTDWHSVVILESVK